MPDEPFSTRTRLSAHHLTRHRGLKARAVAVLATATLLVGACGGGSVEDDVATATDVTLSAGERCRAIDDLAVEGEPAVVPLHALAADPSARVARCARKALSEITDPEAVGALVDLLDDPDPGVVAGATEALGWIADDAAVRPIQRLLTRPHPAVVLAAIEALGRIGDPHAVPALERVALARGLALTANRDVREARRAAVLALGYIGDPRAQATLVTVLGTDPAMSRVAGVALALVYQDDVTPLLPLLDDADNIALAYALVDVGQRGTEDALVTALLAFGDLDLAEYYLNCGSRKLENAAETWASRHGYTVYSTPGTGGGQWGSGV